MIFFQIGFFCEVPEAKKTSASEQAIPSWESLEMSGAVVARIDVLPQDVFDPSKKGEGHWLAKAANFIHIATKKRVVERELLFKAGDKVDARRIRETERNLRALDFIREAAIVPVLEEDGSITARVTTWDSWSLKLSGKYNQAGGNNAWNLKLHEANLLGLGKGVEFAYAKDQERTTRRIGYTDPRLFSSRWALEANYEDLSDGRARFVKLEYPFYSLETRWYALATASQKDSLLNLYDFGHLLYTAPSRLEEARAGGAWAYSVSGRRAFRVGLEFRWSGAQYGPVTSVRPSPLAAPELEDRRFRGPVLLWSFVEDRFDTFRDLKTMGFTEDYNLGWQVKTGLGYFSRSLGSWEDATYLELEATKSWWVKDSTLFLLESKSRARNQSGGWHDAITDTHLAVYNRSFPWQTLAGFAGVFGGTRPDPEDWVYLGGFDGLRGYPDHFRAGDRSWQASFEDRIITPWVLWGIAQIGFVAYVDAGAIRQFTDGRWSPVYADVGAGLRVGDLKSAFGKVWLLTIAAPLRREPGMDRYQFVFGNVIRF
jgi:hypothetical protein